MSADLIKAGQWINQPDWTLENELLSDGSRGDIIQPFDGLQISSI